MTSSAVWIRSLVNLFYHILSPSTYKGKKIFARDVQYILQTSIQIFLTKFSVGRNKESTVYNITFLRKIFIFKDYAELKTPKKFFQRKFN